MIKPQRINQSSMIQQLRSALGDPPPTALARSQARVKRWLAQEAPLIRWGEMNSPLGRLFVAVSDRGLCAVDFGRSEADFLARNPVPIVIPCHRVIASDGSLGGYSGGTGLPAKRWLLRLEGASL